MTNPSSIIVIDHHNHDIKSITATMTDVPKIEKCDLGMIYEFRVNMDTLKKEQNKDQINFIWSLNGKVYSVIFDNVESGECIVLEKDDMISVYIKN